MGADAQLESLCHRVADQRLQWAVGENTGPKLRYALLNAKQLHAGGFFGETPPPTVTQALEAFRTIHSLPADWDMNAFMHGAFGYRLLSKTTLSRSSQDFAALQMMLDDTFVDRYTRDRQLCGGGNVPKRLVLQNAE